MTPLAKEVIEALPELPLPLEDRLRLRLETLKRNRESFIADAQRQLAALDGAIGELSALLLTPGDLNGHEDVTDAEKV
jgi:hypothetical protein